MRYLMGRAGSSSSPRSSYFNAIGPSDTPFKLASSLVKAAAAAAVGRAAAAAAAGSSWSLAYMFSVSNLSSDL
ncbi:unnamed protein product [Anisakis simplex]|uniref:Uncharacterized protein n=1 Tax=Anisakis simplex TaxID=6269 RepID=A0A0M3K112_ANISI|nr:unnamed protein product [Anisakis simplex]